MKFRKKPVVIEAERVTDLLPKFKGAWADLPSWVSDHYEKGHILVQSTSLQVKTLEGWVEADTDCWLIRGVEGEIYPCKASIFEKTYEEVTE